MTRKDSSSGLSKEQSALLKKIYELFVSAGDWPRYRDLERILGFRLARVIKPLHLKLVTFYTPIGVNTTCALTLRGLETQKAATDDLANALRAMRYIARRAESDGPGTTVSSEELEEHEALSSTEMSRVTKILMNSLDVHNVVGNIMVPDGGSLVEFGVTEYSPDFVAVQTVDDFEAVNREIVQRREEEADLSRPAWSAPRVAGASRLSEMREGRPAERVYHRHVEAASRELLNGRHFSEAVRAALQRFELEVQRRSSLPRMSGRDLMGKAFAERHPILKLRNADEAGSTEQEGFRFMATGAMLGLRNKYSHGRRVRMSEQAAHEQLGFVSYLFRRLDQTTRVD